jgi:hypothetical protein
MTYSVSSPGRRQREQGAAETDGEAQNLYPELSGDPEVAELVDGHEYEDRDQKGCDTGDEFDHGAAMRPCSAIKCSAAPSPAASTPRHVVEAAEIDRFGGQASPCCAFDHPGDVR